MTRWFVHMRNVFLLLAPIAGCGSQPPVPRAPHVEVSRFMGPWYVIAVIPTRPERDAVNAVETYTLAADGSIITHFRYRDGESPAKVKEIHATGFVRPDTNNAVWGMQFIWPIKAQYVISWLDPSYQRVIVARDKRDYVWIMARTPTIDDKDYAALTARVAAMGYDLSRLRKVPQAWPERSGM